MRPKVFLIFGFFALLLFLPIWVKGEVFSPIGLVYRLDPLFQHHTASFHGRINPLLSDLTFEFYPWRAYATQAFRAGVIPWDNPYIFGGEGQAFVGNDQSAFFFPLNLVSYFLPLWSQFNFVAVLKIWLAGFFTYLFLRSLKLSPKAAVLGGIVFAFSGFFQVWLGFGITNVVLLVPGVLWVMEGLIAGRSWRLYSLALVALLGSQVLAGHLETVFHALVLYVVYTVYRLGWTRNWRRWWVFVPAVSLSVLVGLVQVIPVVRFLSKTALFAGRSYGGFEFISTTLFGNLLSLVTFINPNFFGNPVSGNFYNPFSNYNEQIWYFGLATLILSLLSLCLWRRERDVRFWWVVGVASVLLALRIPGLDLVNQLPVLRWFDPQRLRAFTTLAAAVLAAFGFEAVFAGNVPKRFLRLILQGGGAFMAAYGLGIVLVRWGLFTFRGQILSFGQGRFGRITDSGMVVGDVGLGVVEQSQQVYKNLLDLFIFFNWQMCAPLFWAGLSLGLLLLFWRGKLKAGYAESFFLILIFLELYSFAAAYYPTAPAGLDYPTSGLITRVQEDESSFSVLGIGNTLNPNWSMVYNLVDVRGADFATRGYQSYFLETAGEVRVANLYHLVLMPTQKFLNEMRIKYVFAPEEWEPEASLGLTLLDEEGSAKLWFR